MNSFLVTLSSLLIRTSYSRGMETEVYLYAVATMQQRHMDPMALFDILQKLEQAHSDKPDRATRDTHWLDYLSTHPFGEDRYAPLRRSMVH